MNNAPFVPRCEWSLIGDGHQISANKTILLWDKKRHCCLLGQVDLDEEDPRGRLLDQDGYRLKWEDHSHYCYVPEPLYGSAHESATVYAYVNDHWKEVLRCPSHRKIADVVECLRLAGVTAQVTYNNRPPSPRA